MLGIAIANAPAAFAARTPTGVSSKTTHVEGSVTPSRAMASAKISGAGFPFSTSSPVATAVNRSTQPSWLAIFFFKNAAGVDVASAVFTPWA